MAKTFKVAGITSHDGSTKVRFTDDMVRRIKQFTKGGATRCDFVELPSEMTKVEALKYLASLDQFKSASDQATIADALEDREKELSKGEVKVKTDKKSTKASTKKAVKAKPSVEAIKNRAKKVEKSTASVADILANTEPALF